MLNLIRMDLYRLLRSKTIRIGAIVALAIAFLGMLFNFGVIELLKITIQERPESAAEWRGFLSADWMYGVDFADVVLTGTSALSLFLSCMLVASFVGAEQSCGYIKNVAGQLPNRGMTVVSKYIVTCIVQIMVFVIYTIVSIICAFAFFKQYIIAYSIGALVCGLFLRILVFCAINAIVIFFCTFTKSHAIAMVVGAILGIGITRVLYAAVSGLLGLLKIDIDVSKFSPDGLNDLINVYELTTSNIAVRIVIVSVIFIAVFVTSAAFVFNKRDVK